MPRPFMVALWSRPSSKKLDRTPDQNLMHLREAIGKFDARIRPKEKEFDNPLEMQVLIVAPEYYFARSYMGKWNGSSKAFETRSIEQDQKDHIVRELRAISRQYPAIGIIPGSIAWQKPLDRPESDRFQRNKLTGETTETLKQTDRRAKALARVEKSGGNRPFEAEVSELFATHVRKAIKDRKLGIYQEYEDLLPTEASAAETKVWTKTVIQGVANDPRKREEILNYYQLSRSAVYLTPIKQEKLETLREATHMMQNTTYLLFGGETRFRYHKIGDFHEAIGADGKTVYVPGHMAGLSPPVGGLTFGIEICFDHSLGLLKRESPKNQKKPDVHVVISDKVDRDKKQMFAQKYFVHASTDASSGGVHDVKGSASRVHSEKAQEEDKVDGGRIRFYKLTV
jgi:hypothetical protein